MSKCKGFQLRVATNRDRDSVVELIDGVYREYDDRICLEGADGDLLDLERAYAGRGGAFVVLHGKGQVVGCHATLPTDTRLGLGTFRRLYLAAEFRGAGCGDRLMDWAIDWSRQAGWRRVEFWSDTRFSRAHRFFERFGFRRDGRTREMNDGYEPYREFGFALDLSSSISRPGK